MDFFKIKKTRDFGSLISDSFLYVSRHFKSLGKSVLYIVVPFIVLSIIFTYQYLTMALNVDPANFSAATLSSAVVVVNILNLLISAILATVVLVHVKLTANNQEENNSVNFNDIWEGFKSNFLVVLLISIAVSIATGIGLLFLIIPGIFIGVKLSLVATVYVLEDKEFGESFSRSWNLVKDYWWITFGVGIAMLILIVIMQFGVTLPFRILGFVFGSVGLGTSIGIFEAINAGIIGPLSNILYALVYICFGLHYYNLKERKEGAELSKRIDNIAQESN